MFKKILSLFRFCKHKDPTLSFLEIVRSTPSIKRTSRSIHATTDKRTDEHLKVGHEDIELISVNIQKPTILGYDTSLLTLGNSNIAFCTSEEWKKLKNADGELT